MEHGFISLEEKIQSRTNQYTLNRFKIFSISHETIYQYLLYDKRKSVILHNDLRFVPIRRRKRYKSYDTRGRLAGKRPITDRSDIINKRLEIGHWEGNTVYWPGSPPLYSYTYGAIKRFCDH